ncbi:hypothetical protein [Streptomyces sp.]|uniref:hypothetical protein n=1 Tax=Streptomyces sp. TaxID=1931 RepID=UPI00281249F0|nr:hypothetical protein [Streptomyces sp.]
MAASNSWKITPSLDTIQQFMEVDNPSKVVLHIYYRQPLGLDETSGLQNAGAIVTGFSMTDTTLLDVLSGKVVPQDQMPFALADTRAAVEEQYSELPDYAKTTDSELFPFGHGLTYEDETTTDYRGPWQGRRRPVRPHGGGGPAGVVVGGPR